MCDDHGLRANYRKRGSYYEAAAAAWLKKQGYEILESNFRCRAGEIDLIAKDENMLVFIEVKYRSTDKKGSPAQAVDSHKRRRIIAAARWYMAGRGMDTSVPVRFDVAAICGSTVTLYKNAFYA